jgi:hypothetical protein
MFETVTTEFVQPDEVRQMRFDLALAMVGQGVLPHDVKRRVDELMPWILGADKPKEPDAEVEKMLSIFKETLLAIAKDNGGRFRVFRKSMIEARRRAEFHWLYNEEEQSYEFIAEPKSFQP